MVHNGGFYLPGNFSMEWTRCQSENYFAKLLQTEALDFITFNLKFCAAAGAFAIFSGSRRRESGGGRMGTTSLKRARVRTGLAEPEQQRNPEHVQKEQFCQTAIGIRSSRCLFVDMSIIGRTTKDTVLIIKVPLKNWSEFSWWKRKAIVSFILW